MFVWSLFPFSYLNNDLFYLPGDLNIPQNLMQILTNGGAVAVGLAVVAALAALAMPMFGIRYCQLLGNCDNAYQYSANSVYQNDMYGQYPQASYPTGNSYQKRYQLLQHTLLCFTIPFFTFKYHNLDDP